MASPWGPDAGLSAGGPGWVSPRDKKEPLAEAASPTSSHPSSESKTWSLNLMGHEHPTASWVGSSLARLGMKAKWPHLTDAAMSRTLLGQHGCVYRQHLPSVLRPGWAGRDRLQSRAPRGLVWFQLTINRLCDQVGHWSL